MLALALCFSGLTLCAAPKDQSWTGWISDSKCRAKGANADHAACAKKCSAAGEKPVLVSDKHRKVVAIDTGRIHALHQHAHHARLVHEAHLPFQRNLLKAVRPIANRVAPIELPPDTYFGNIRDLFEKLDGVDELMENPRVTSARLVTNAEKMLLRETQRAFVYFSLHGLTVDAVVVNRLLPDEVRDTWFSEWHQSQDKTVREIEDYFAPVPVKKVPLYAHEVLGKQRLEELARVLYAGGEDPEAVTRTEKPYTFGKRDGLYEIRVLLPFATKGERSCSRRATNWWCRSAPSAGTLACHDPWLRCRRHERGWKARR